MRKDFAECNWDSQIQSVVGVLRECFTDYFRKPTRVAVITQLVDGESELIGKDSIPESIWLFDPDGVFEGRESELRDYFKANPRWQEVSESIPFGADRDFVPPSIDGCFSFASYFAAGTFYGYAIAFFVETDETICTQPVEAWLRHATFVLGNEIERNEQLASCFVPTIGCTELEPSQKQSLY